MVEMIDTVMVQIMVQIIVQMMPAMMVDMMVRMMDAMLPAATMVDPALLFGNFRILSQMSKA